jgi:hypothetical protein
MIGQIKSRFGGMAGFSSSQVQPINQEVFVNVIQRKQCIVV